MNIYDQQRSNHTRTVVIMAAFVALFAALGLGFDYVHFGFDPLGLEGDSSFPFPVGTLASLGAGVYFSIWGLYGGDHAVLSSTGAVRIYPGTTELQKKQLLNLVEEMSIAAGLPQPRVYLISDPDPNAFATGRDPEHASIAVTQGLVDKLNREELQGVIAHEMSHIRNFDIRLMTVVAALVGAVVLLNDWSRRALRWGGAGMRKRVSKGSKGGLAGIAIPLIWLVTMLLAPVLAQLLAMAVSRQREYLADASAAEITRNPMGLASALKKIEMDAAPTRSILRGSAHLCIADPLGRKIGLKQGFWPNLLATHPPMHLRINALKKMAYQYESPLAEA